MCIKSWYPSWLLVFKHKFSFYKHVSFQSWIYWICLKGLKNYQLLPQYILVLNVSVIKKQIVPAFHLMCFLNVPQVWKFYAAILWLGNEGSGPRTNLDKITKSYIWSTQALQVGRHFKLTWHIIIWEVLYWWTNYWQLYCYLGRKLRCSVYRCVEHWIQVTNSLPEEGGVVAKMVQHILDDIKPLVSQTKVTLCNPLN